MSDWFFAWLKDHATATGAGPDAIAALAANESIITGSVWHATEAEMRACTSRLVASMRTPKFANEHLDALGRELIAIRGESARATLPAGRPAGCELCGGVGWVVVPVLRCLFSGMLVVHPEHRRIITTAVTCDNCERGRYERDGERDRYDDLKDDAARKRYPRRWTLGEYYDRTRGIDGYQLLREHEAALAADARRREPRDPAAFAAMFPRIAAVLAGAGSPA